MELLSDSSVISMEVAAEHTGPVDSPDAVAIESMGRLLGQRIHAEVQEYTAVLSKLVLAMQRASTDEASDPTGASQHVTAAAPPALHERCCAAKLLRMHALTAAIGRALDRAGADQ
ncbi:hypothetical protein FJT64_011579 [Amphibalanus amphitrite]|uniref:Uncharacterized protein n=1 Tax=Amphibalanus amphitrite TaxID=1232801 RepID=A0A6A4VIB0_AMPAM|nr:uncharacterized protein LOC122365391 [Amphibalanus amphitrite]XP_043192494.1 uncharacterized protein LOC122365391 [Amphibalanus amphitrite]XP_043192495.1 uncharacterized protein LOC122365391 [Amphibalanus amphitrite]XP_043192496.1 uncharacterized protein LOC122365391 [Amphibalanus amphitrite]KAF0290212.1 hypothetical protein FJT64_011579 [Amphibalanus amphitrite]